MEMIYGVIGLALAGLLFTLYKASWVTKQHAGEGKMIQIAKYIADGALAFLKAEYRALSIFVIVISVLLALTAKEDLSHWTIGVAFILGACLSALAGFLGMKIATKSNVRTAQAAKTSLSKALDI